MIATGQYIPPEDLMDHENMIAWALHYFMTQEFTSLDDQSKQLLKQHIRDRGKLAATEKSAGAAQPAPAPAPPGPVPSESAGPVPAQSGPPGPLPG